ncbi:MAG: hypothetical protein M3069_09650 [Chloroflexota bacterium]|nr:hypothetical protein [Chloroflexota bacterium]
MEPNVVVVLVGAAALLALLARGRRRAPQSEPVPVRVGDDPAPRPRN